MKYYSLVILSLALFSCYESKDTISLLCKESDRDNNFGIQMNFKESTLKTLSHGIIFSEYTMHVFPNEIFAENVKAGVLIETETSLNINRDTLHFKKITTDGYNVFESDGKCAIHENKNNII